MKTKRMQDMVKGDIFWDDDWGPMLISKDAGPKMASTIWAVCLGPERPGEIIGYPESKKLWPVVDLTRIKLNYDDFMERIER